MITFDRQGLIPAVIMDDATEEVLMVAFMNQEALQLTRETGYTHFYSRTREKIWQKGEQSGNTQQVQDIFVNCEENSLLIRVVQTGGAACHEGYRSCYYRRLLPDDSYEVVAKRIFDPAIVYHLAHGEREAPTEGATPAISDKVGQELEKALRQLYGVYLYLRDHDLSEESNTSRLLQERSQGYLVSRLADELQEMADVQSGEHVHLNKQHDTILEGSQVGYWLFLLAAGCNVPFQDFKPHEAVLQGYRGEWSENRIIELRQECLSLISTDQPAEIAKGLGLGFVLIGWSCAAAAVSPLDPAEYDLDQMRRKGLVS